MRHGWPSLFYVLSLGRLKQTVPKLRKKFQVMRFPRPLWFPTCNPLITLHEHKNPKEEQSVVTSVKLLPSALESISSPSSANQFQPPSSRLPITYQTLLHARHRRLIKAREGGLQLRRKAGKRSAASKSRYSPLVDGVSHGLVIAQTSQLVCTGIDERAVRRYCWYRKITCRRPVQRLIESRRARARTNSRTGTCHAGSNAPFENPSSARFTRINRNDCRRQNSRSSASLRIVAPPPRSISCDSRRPSC